jgi:hypothetical protein
MTWPSLRFRTAPATLVSFVMLLLLGVPAAALACSCLPSPSPCAAMNATDAIFIGTPVAIAPRDGPDGMRGVRFHFEVDRPIKGIDATTTVDVDTPADTAACGYPFEPGVQYLVYGSRGAGSLMTSLCSRTGPLEARRDDLELLIESAATGTVRPRLFGAVYRMQLRLDGFFMHFDGGVGVPDVPIRVRDGAQVLEAHTDAAGRFSMSGLRPGSHRVEAQLPPQYAPLFDREHTANVDSSSGELSVIVTTVPLRGTARPADGSAGVRQLKLRRAQIGPDGRVAFERSTLAFTEADGTWKVPGLPAGRYLLGVSAFDPPVPEAPYPTTWYPNALQPEEATVLEVADDRPMSVNFRLPTRLAESTITGVALDADGTPIPNVSVTLHDTEGRPAFTAVGYATSDGQGRFSFPALVGRHYRIQGTVLRPGGAQSDLVEITDEALQRGVTVVLRPG